ncbi:MAG: phage portal protein [Chloroflexaceae bacterium]|nr:phage portal protein [Chloroflexaceae bacterium]
MLPHATKSLWAYHAQAIEGEERATALETYQLVPYLYRAIDVRAKAIAGLPWSLRRLVDDAEVRDDPAYCTLLAGMRLRLYQTEAALCLYGAAYWLKEVNRLGRNLTPRWILPASITPRYDQQIGLVGFERSTGMGSYPLDPEDLVYIWQPALGAEIGPGVPPAQVALAAAGVLHQLDLFMEGFFRRGAIRATLLAVEGNPQPCRPGPA